MAVQQAAKGGRKQGIIIGCVVAIVLGGVGYVAGGAAEQGNGRTKSKSDAADLKNAVTKASASLKSLQEKMEAGATSLAGRKFPDTLSKDLGGIHVDFDGTQLAGRRFSGFPQDTTHELVDFINAVDSINERKSVIQRALDRLQKPMTEQFAVPQGTSKIGYVVAVDKDPSGNYAGFLSGLTDPIAATAQNIQLPAKFKFATPGGGGGNTELPRYAGGDASKSPVAIYVVPKTFETVCPSAQNGQVAQLAAQLGDFIRTIKGEAGAPPGTDAVVDPKPGLIERADKLADALNKIQ
jgi:hypothetical protein